MGIFDKFIPNEIKKPFKKIGKETVNFLRSAGDKLVPNEIRKFAPYLAAAAPYTNFMFPGSGFFSGAIGRGLLSSLYNVAGQTIADPEGEDINLLSAALAGAQGYGATPGAGDTLRGMTTAGDPALATKEGIMSQLQNAPLGSQSISEAANTSLLTKAKDLGITGAAKAADFLGGAKETLGDIGTGEIDLFTKEGAKAAAKASAPILSQGSGDLAYAEANKALREFNKTQAEELAQAGLSLAEINLARRDAITSSMLAAQFDQDVINDTLAELGLLDLADGGIASLKDGGMLNFGGREMDLRGGGFVPIGRKERADDVPARLSKNEFVMTADAVRAAGGGSVNKGAQRMYDIMNRLEARA
jgi:hypothetical protein